MNGMDPLQYFLERRRVLCLEQEVSGSAFVSTLAGTTTSYALDRVVPPVTSLVPASARTGDYGSLQCGMPIGTLLGCEDITDDIQTKAEILCMTLQACALQEIHNALAIASAHPVKKAWHRKARAITPKGSRPH